MPISGSCALPVAPSATPVAIRPSTLASLLVAVATLMSTIVDATMSVRELKESEMIAMLSLQYNRARQAYITKELSEIVSGAESLK